MTQLICDLLFVVDCDGACGVSSCDENLGRENGVALISIYLFGRVVVI